MSVKKKVGMVFLALLAFLVILTLIKLTNQTKATNSAKHKVKIARLKIEDKSDKKITLFNSVISTSGLTTARIASSKVDVCYISHQDSGWMATNWYQNCYLRYVTGYNTNLTKNEVLGKIRNSKDVLSYVNAISKYQASDPNFCELTETRSSFMINYFKAGTPKDDAWWCVMPGQLQGSGGVEGPIMLDNELSVRKYYGFDAKSIKKNKNTLWVEKNVYYYHEELGCNFIRLLFCESPRSKPAHVKE